MSRPNVVQVVLTREQMAALDKQRGLVPRSAYLREVFASSLRQGELPLPTEVWPGLSGEEKLAGLGVTPVDWDRIRKLRETGEQDCLHPVIGEGHRCESCGEKVGI